MVDASLTPIERGTITADVNNLREGASLATASEPNPDAEVETAPVYNVVIDHPDGTILWDTGSHPDAADGHWPASLYDAFEHTGLRPLEDDLADAGYAISEIDYVIQSHLHLDHAGGLETFAGTETRFTSTNANSNTPTTARKPTPRTPISPTSLRTSIMISSGKSSTASAHTGSTASSSSVSPGTHPACSASSSNSRTRAQEP